MKQLLKKLLHPSPRLLALVYPLTLLAIGGAMASLFLIPQDAPHAFVSYLLYALSAILLGYSVYTLVLVLPKAKSHFVSFLEGHTLTHTLLHSYGYRTLVSAALSFLISIIYGGFNGYLGISEASIWYGALAAYYIFLALVRGWVLLGYRAKTDALAKAKNYRLTGVFLILIHLSLSAAIAQMIFQDRGFQYGGLVIYAVAAYTFYKITVAIIHFIRTRTSEDLTVRATRNINLADALVSILALQTALLHTFGQEGVDISLFNTLTGSVVSLFSLGLGVAMTYSATRHIKHIRMEQTHEA